MKENSIVFVQYKDDKTFEDRLSLLQHIIHKNKICDMEEIRQLFSNFKIQCWWKDKPITDINRIVVNFFKIPFFI